jgi:hypothetical protein
VLALALSAAAMAPFGALFTVLGSPNLGVILILLAFPTMIAAMALAAFAQLNVKCPNCEQRFFSFTFPVWPFEWRCAVCGEPAGNGS